MMDAPATCLNCGARLAGRYCGSCGQRNVAARLRWRDLANDLLAQIADLDHPWLRTIRDLTLDPGGTARAFVDGRRVIYVPPIKYAFYALLVMVILSPAANDQVPVGAAEGGWRAFLVMNVPVFVLLLVPVLTVMLRVLFLRAGRNLVEVGVFALYMLAQVALAMTLFEFTLVVTRWIGFEPDGVAAAIANVGIVVVVLPLYLLYGVVRFFRTGITWALVASLFAGFGFAYIVLVSRFWLAYGIAPT